MISIHLLVSAGLWVIPAVVGAMELSGSVLGVDRKPLEGVQVRLLGGNVMATTNFLGEWRLQSQSTRIGSREVRRPAEPRAVVLMEDGRLRVRIAGRDLAGRGVGEHRLPVGAVLAAGRSQAGPDTLTFSLGGKVVLRDTISSSRTGIVRILDSTFNPAIVYGSLTDSRDGQIYRTVKIGSQAWMAENLNFRKGGGADSGWWFKGSPDSGARFGRLYTWASLMGLSDSCNAKACADQVWDYHRGLCPEGWHVPTDAEWDTLKNAVGGSSIQGTKLKSTSGWHDNGNGTDDHGFGARPGGYFYDGSFRDVGLEGNWWSATEFDARDVRSNHLYYQNSIVIPIPEGKILGFAARCVQGAAQIHPRVALAGMKRIPAGTFIMGSPATEADRYTDETQHEVTLSAFHMDTASVTQGQYLSVMGVNPSALRSCGATCPVENVTWFDALLYCNASSKLVGLDTVYSYTSMTGTYGKGVTALAGITADLSRNGYHLPTEAQWEYAARGGTTTTYYWGNDASTDTVRKYAWISANTGSTRAVATKPPNPFGLYDMAGNVWQWTNDWHGTYSTIAQTDPTGPSSGTYRVLRGGGYSYGPMHLRSAYRGHDEPDTRGMYLGFRCVRSGS